jgi:glutathione-specific gamma-glutamylcyclotransferase
VWIFAYGSLIFRPSFSFLERRRAFVAGWARRFWQGSPDHRGVPEAPGRVVTLVPQEGESCGGCAYRIDPRELELVLAALDVREQAGFERRTLPLFDGAPDEAASADPFGEGVTWIAGASNQHFLGPLPESEIAAFVRSRKGPSGPNSEYVLRLAEALRALAIVDAHVEDIARHLGIPAAPPAA